MQERDCQRELVFFFFCYVLCVHKHAMAHIWESEDNLCESSLSFYHMGSTYRLSGLAASILTDSHLASPGFLLM